MRRIGLSGALLVISITTAHAAGLNLSWDHCYSDGPAVSNKAFACLSSTGDEVLVASFVAAAAQPGVVRLDSKLEFRSATPTTLPGWLFPGGCSQVALQPGSFMPGTDVNCHDWTGQGGAGVTITGYFFPNGDERQSALTLASSIGVSGASGIVPGVEYVAFRIRVSHDALAGAGSCGGCSQPVTIALALVRTTSSGAAGSQTLILPVSGTSNVVQWQSGGPTATRHTTWGAVKSLYR